MLGDLSFLNCYNKGRVEGSSIVGGIISESHSDLGKVNITNCYNTGDISGSNSGEIIGKINRPVDQRNCYKKSTVLTGNLGDAFIQDKENINNGYPILKWQSEDSK